MNSHKIRDQISKYGKMSSSSSCSSSSVASLPSEGSYASTERSRSPSSDSDSSYRHRWRERRRRSMERRRRDRRRRTPERRRRSPSSSSSSSSDSDSRRRARERSRSPRRRRSPSPYNVLDEFPYGINPVWCTDMPTAVEMLSPAWQFCWKNDRVNVGLLYEPTDRDMLTFTRAQVEEMLCHEKKGKRWSQIPADYEPRKNAKKDAASDGAPHIKGFKIANNKKTQSVSLVSSFYDSPETSPKRNP